ncbi:hypothetical protein PU560_02565, partial [Georgenia sp. 10Sc9-8]|nr:hypothetical protein [Georgenia halotolerans]
MTARDRRGWRGLSASVLAAAIARPVRSPHPVRPSGDRALRGGSGLDAWAGPRPALVGGVPARQADPTACGAAVLLVLAAGGDDRVEQWVGAGRTGGRPSPPEVPPGVAPTTAAGRLSAAQRRVHQRARSR